MGLHTPQVERKYLVEFKQLLLQKCWEHEIQNSKSQYLQEHEQSQNWTPLNPT